MKMTDLNKDVVKCIMNDIAMSCRRLGIDTTFYLKGDEDNVLMSTSFQTMPVLFKEIHIKGNIYFEEDADDIKVTIVLGYRYKTFDGGENGHILGRVVYIVDKSYTEKKIRDISMYIDKIKGIAI